MNQARRWCCLCVLGVLLLLEACSSSSGEPVDVKVDQGPGDMQGPGDVKDDQGPADVQGQDGPGDAVPDQHVADVVPDSDSVVASDMAADQSDDVQFGAPLPSEFRGWVRIVQDSWDGSTSWGRAEAEFWASPLPTTQVPVQQSGECVLLVGALMDGWNCVPECEWGTQTCIDEQCVDYPERTPVGSVAIKGLTLKQGAFTAVLSVNTDGTYDGLYEDSVQWFEAGDPITVTAQGDVGPALDLTVYGVSPFVAEVPPLAQAIADGTELKVTWEPGVDNPPGTRIVINLATGWHGATNLTTILCDAEDDGELTIPASMVAQFHIPSCGECEASYMGRYTRAVLETEGGLIELLVLSRRSFVAWWN